MAAKKKKAKKAPARKKSRRKVIPNTHKKRGRGQPPFKPTPEQRRQVETMVGLGIKHRDIARLIENPRTGKGLSVSTLERHFRKELDRGAAKVEAMVAGSLLQKAISKDHPQSAVSAMFILKCKFKWRQADKVTHEFEGNSGVLVVPASMSPVEWIAEQQKKNETKRGPKSDGDD